MKKTTNSNPLKYFNDAAAAKKKTVITGNDKLVKAQAGYTKLQGPIDPDVANKIKEIETRPMVSPYDTNYNADKIKKIVDYSRNSINSKNISKGDDSSAPINITGVKQSYFNKKSGGAVKSKKK